MDTPHPLYGHSEGGVRAADRPLASHCGEGGGACPGSTVADKTDIGKVNGVGLIFMTGGQVGTHPKGVRGYPLWLGGGGARDSKK